MSSPQSSCVFPSDSASNSHPDDVSSPYGLALSVLSSLGPAPSGMAGLPGLLSSVSEYSGSKEAVVNRYMDHQDALLGAYVRGVESVAKLLDVLSPPSSAAVSPRVTRPTTSVPGYSPPLTYEQMQTLNERVGTRHFSVAFESLHAKYSKGYDDGTSFSVHRFGSKGSSVASSNFLSAAPGRCYLMLIAGGHKSAAREMFGLNPDFGTLLSAPAHMFSVSALLSVRFTRTGFSSFHAACEGTYSAISVFTRYIQQQHFNYTYSSSVWDGTLLQAIACREDCPDIALRCTETLPFKLELGGEPEPAPKYFPAGGMTQQQLGAMSSLADAFFPSRSWKFVQCLGDGHEVAVLSSCGIDVHVAYGSDYSLVGMRPSGDSRFWFPLHASERPNDVLRDMVAALPTPVVRPSDALVRLSCGDFSTCKCAIHSWPDELSEFKRTLQLRPGVVGPAKFAFEGTRHACLASEDTRYADRDFLLAVLRGLGVDGYRSVRVDSTIAPYASSTSMATAEFGPGYCYLECIRGRYRYRVARLLGPCPFVCDVAVMFRAVGRCDPRVAVSSVGDVGHCTQLDFVPKSGGVGLWKVLESLVQSRGPTYRMGADVVVSTPRDVVVASRQRLHSRLFVEFSDTRGMTKGGVMRSLSTLAGLVASVVLSGDRAGWAVVLDFASSDDAGVALGFVLHNSGSASFSDFVREACLFREVRGVFSDAFLSMSGTTGVVAFVDLGALSSANSFASALVAGHSNLLPGVSAPRVEVLSTGGGFVRVAVCVESVSTRTLDVALRPLLAGAAVAQSFVRCALFVSDAPL